MPRAHNIAAILISALLANMSDAHAFSDDAPKDALKETQEQIASEKKRKEELALELKAMEKELNGLRSNTVALSKEIRLHEQELVAREEEMASLAAEAAQKQEALDTRQQELAQLLRSMRRLQQVPPTALLIKEDAAEDCCF